MNKYLIIAATILTGVVTLLSFLLKEEKAETERLAGNQRSMMEDVTFYRTKDSLSAASVERITLTAEEYKKYNAEQAEQIEALGIKISRLQSTSSIGTETKYEIKTNLKDSLIMRDSLITLKCIELHTPYLDVSGCIENNLFAGGIISRDTIDQAVYRVPKQFLFIKWGCKAIRQEIVCRNPYTQITYTKYIELK